MNRRRTKFTIDCDIPERWVPYFLGMLKDMQELGSLGCSRSVEFYADGDGDFRPKFSWETGLPDPVVANDHYYDAG